MAGLQACGFRCLVAHSRGFGVSGFRASGLQVSGFRGFGFLDFSVLWLALPVSRVRVSGLRVSGFGGLAGSGSLSSFRGCGFLGSGDEQLKHRVGNPRKTFHSEYHQVTLLAKNFMLCMSITFFTVAVLASPSSPRTPSAMVSGSKPLATEPQSVVMLTAQGKSCAHAARSTRHRTHSTRHMAFCQEYLRPAIGPRLAWATQLWTQRLIGFHSTTFLFHMSLCRRVDVRLQNQHYAEGTTQTHRHTHTHTVFPPDCGSQSRQSMSLSRLGIGISL